MWLVNRTFGWAVDLIVLPFRGMPPIVGLTVISAVVSVGMLIGFAKGVRSSDASAAGAIPEDILTDNTGAWSGDHIMDHEAVPGVLVSNRLLQVPAASLKDLAAAVLAEFGVGGFPVIAAPDPEDPPGSNR